MLVKDLIEVIAEERPNDNVSVLTNPATIEQPISKTPHGNPIKE
jgi:hypothetical protein